MLQLRLSCCMFFLFSAVCSFTYSQKDEIRALSLQYQSKGYKKCDYHIHAPRNNFVKLNFTNFFGFRTHRSMHSGYLKPDSDLDLCIPPEIVIKEKEGDSDLKQFVKICKNQNNLQSPKVFHSKLNYLKITYIWIENQSSGFTLDFDFHHNKSKYKLIYKRGPPPHTHTHSVTICTK